MAGRESSLVFDRAPHALCGVRGAPEDNTGFGSSLHFPRRLHVVSKYFGHKFSCYLERNVRSIGSHSGKSIMITRISSGPKSGETRGRLPFLTVVPWIVQNMAMRLPQLSSTRTARDVFDTKVLLTFAVPSSLIMVLNCWGFYNHRLLALLLFFRTEDIPPKAGWEDLVTASNYAFYKA